MAGPAAYARRHLRQGGALIAALGEAKRTANTDIATWAFEAPAGESIAGATLWRAGDADGGAVVNAAYEFWFAGPEQCQRPTPATCFDQCESGLACPAGVGNLAQPLSAENRVVVPAANLGSHLYVNASCVGESRIQLQGRRTRPKRLRGRRVPVRG